MTNRGWSRDPVAVASMGLMVFLAAAWTLYGLYGERLVSAMYAQKAISFLRVGAHIRAQRTISDLLHDIEDGLVAVTALCSGLVVFLLFRRRKMQSSTDATPRLQSQAGIGRLLFSVSVLLSCSWCCFMALRHGHEEPWYVISRAMTFAVGPPYRHRVLFILVGRLLDVLWPSLSLRFCFFTSQLFAILLAMIFIKKWAAMFVDRDVAFVAQLLLAAMLVPTFSYWNSYDVGIVLFYTACLWFLFKRRTVLYLVAFVLGTLNHEIMLFLVILSAFVCYKSRMNTRALAAFAIAQLGLYGLVRAALFHFLPVPRAWQAGKVWFNFETLFHFYERPRFLARTAITMLWFLAAGCLGFRRAPQDLRRATILLPLLLGSTVLVGQINEARQFVAFIPIAIGLILCGSASRAGVDHKAITVNEV